MRPMLVWLRITTKNINICFNYLFYPSGEKKLHVFFFIFFDRLRFCKEQLCLMLIYAKIWLQCICDLFNFGGIFFFVPKFCSFFFPIFRHTQNLLGRAPSLAKLWTDSFVVFIYFLKLGEKNNITFPKKQRLDCLSPGQVLLQRGPARNTCPGESRTHKAVEMKSRGKWTNMSCLFCIFVVLSLALCKTMIHAAPSTQKY